MKSRPLSILIVAILFIIVGLSGFLYHIKDFFEPSEKLYEIILAQLLRVLAIVCGILLLRANNSGRWVSIVWILSHILISALHSISEMIAHIGFLVVVSILLFLPRYSAYFQNRKQIIR
jgi:amino acid permease